MMQLLQEITDWQTMQCCNLVGRLQLKKRKYADAIDSFTEALDFRFNDTYFLASIYRRRAKAFAKVRSHIIIYNLKSFNRFKTIILFFALVASL